jgi:hypothetical protein
MGKARKKATKATQAKRPPAPTQPPARKPQKRASANGAAAKQKAAPMKRTGVKKPATKRTVVMLDLDAELEAELALIFEPAVRSAMKPALATTAATITSAAADELVGGTWFTGHTQTVQLIDSPATVNTFDGDSRGGDAEYLVFNRGLTVTGTFDLSAIGRSIIVVRGTLKAKRIILGDAVLVVEKAVQAAELMFGPMTEGIFSLAGMQIESDPEDLATAILAPSVALYDRKQREWLLRKNGVPAELAGDLVDDGEVDQRAVKQRLLAGKSIFA